MDLARREQILSQYRAHASAFDAIAARRRGTYAPPPSAVRRRAPVRRISPRGAQVLALLAEGYGNKQIAAELSITLDTAKTHVRNVATALGARNRAHAVAIAIREGILPLERAAPQHPRATTSA